VRLGELLSAALVLLQHGDGEVLLLLFQFEDLFLNCSCCNQPINRYDLVLANAMCPIRRLVFNGWVPPGVVMDHSVGCRQVEATATGLQANEENRYCRVFLKSINSVRPVGGAAIKILVADLVLVERGGNELEHGHELAK